MLEFENQLFVERCSTGAFAVHPVHIDPESRNPFRDESSVIQQLIGKVVLFVNPDLTAITKLERKIQKIATASKVSQGYAVGMTCRSLSHANCRRFDTVGAHDDSGS